MAAGLSSAIDRISAIIEGVASNPKWVRSEQRVSDLARDGKTQAGIDFKYWVGAPTNNRTTLPYVTGSTHDRVYKIEVQLARFLGHGTRHSRDHTGALKDIEERGDMVEQSLTEVPSNWNYATTGIINITQPEAGEAQTFSDETIIWRVQLDVTIRQPHTGVAV